MDLVKAACGQRHHHQDHSGLFFCRGANSQETSSQSKVLKVPVCGNSALGKCAELVPILLFHVALSSLCCDCPACRLLLSQSVACIFLRRTRAAPSCSQVFLDTVASTQKEVCYVKHVVPGIVLSLALRLEMRNRLRLRLVHSEQAENSIGSQQS